jgi:hypothetical protein
VGPVALVAVCTIALVVIAGCSGTVPGSPSTTQVEETGLSWKDIVLTDLQGRGNFSIGTFAGRTAIVQVVSDSCPSCIVQLRREIGEIAGSSLENTGGVVVVALDLDPADGPGFIARYGGGNFTGYSARSPPELTLGLFHRFGPFAINPETIPVILVCPDGTGLLLPPGLKTSATVNQTIAKVC